MNLYNNKEFDKKKYQWDQTAKKKAKKYQIIQNIITIVCVMGIVGSFLIQLDTEWFHNQTYFITIIAMFILACGLQNALSLQRVKCYRELSPREKHDFILYEYHRQKKQAKYIKSGRLLKMAWADVQRNEYKLAQMALDQIVLEDLKIIQFQQVSFLRIIAAVGEGEEQKAQEWLVHYQGVQEECDDQKQQEIDQWILNGNTEQLKEMFERSLLKKDKIHPLRRAVIVMLLTYSVIFTGMARGINVDYGYALRRNFILVSSPIVSILPIILVIWAVVLLKRQNKKDKNRNSSVIRTGVVVGCLWTLIGINTIYIAKQIQGKEMVVSHDEKYAYLDVTISDSQKMRYRTNNPFVMQNTLYTQIMMQKTETENANTETQTSTTSINDQTTGELSAENAMQAVYEYLKEQEKYPDMKLEYKTNAKGETYAKIYTSKEQKNGKTLNFWYGLYSNGTKESKDGTLCDEIVLQKQYEISDEQTQLIDFYLVDPDTKKVTDEHKKTW